MDTAGLFSRFTRKFVGTLPSARRQAMCDRMMWLCGVLRQRNVRVIDGDDPKAMTEYDMLDSFETHLRTRVSDTAEWLTRRRYLVACAPARPRIQAQHRCYYWHTLLRASVAPKPTTLRLPLPSVDNFFLLPQLIVMSTAAWVRSRIAMGHIQLIMHLQRCATASPALLRMLRVYLSPMSYATVTHAPLLLNILALHAKFHSVGLSETSVRNLLHSEACRAYPHEIIDAVITYCTAARKWTPLNELEALSRIVNGAPSVVRQVLEQRLDRLRTTIYLPTAAAPT